MIDSVPNTDRKFTHRLNRNLLHEQAQKKDVYCPCRQRGSSKTQAENKKQSTPVADVIHCLCLSAFVLKFARFL